jgi:hydrogenase expression/formation protein HypE
LLKQPPKLDPRLLIGPQIGEDAAVIDAGDRYLVLATEPVTFATDHIGRYAVHVNANDVAVTDVRNTCEELDVALGGGHTEITQGIDRPILVGQMLGEVAPTYLVRKTRIAIGDQILLTRGLATEGTAILAREKSEQLAGTG